MAEPSEHPTGVDKVGLTPTDFGRYQVFATLGRGGMADVFLSVARGPMGFNKLVVLKRLRAHLADEPGFRDMFLDEARLAARLNHPNVIQSYEVGETNGSFFIAMEYLDGQPLNRVLAAMRAKNEPLDAGVTVRVIAEALGGLSHAHELRDYDGTPLHIIHRDVSPHNVFITYEGQVKLVDFGIAKAALSRSETEVGVLKGKVAYMAPEQAMGGPIDARANLFAMGIVLWELSAGRTLFNSDNAANTLHRLLNEPIPTPSSTGATVDEKLEAIIMRCLEKDPGKRFQTARELREALEGWLRDSGRTVRGEDVGKWVASLFEEKRARVQQEIQRHMAEIGRPSSRAHLMSLTAIEQIERAGGNPSAELANLSSDSGAGRISSRADVPIITSSGTGSMPTGIDGSKRQRRVAIVALLLFALLVAAIVVIALRIKREPQPVAGVASADSASATPPAPPPTPSDTSASIATPPSTATSIPSAASATSAPPAPTPPRGKGGRWTPPARPAPHPAPARPAPTPTPAPPAADNGPPGFLTIDTYPWTRVSEGGRVIGTTPIVHASMPAGTHVLTLENPDQSLKQSYTVTIKSGESVTRRLGLK